ncbi:MAG: hypothetical protein Q4B40_00530 [Clostridia bacterium]|nr:hypothetical protein [Clostridia bacterium]
MNFRYKLMQFMSGRYGIDNMFYMLFGVSAVLSIVNIFVRSTILQLVVYTVIIYAFFRAFSRNIEARRRENRWVNNWAERIKKEQELNRRRKADYTHVYKKCPRCRAVLRLPRRVGKHKTVCPKCNNEFWVRVK